MQFLPFCIPLTKGLTVESIKADRVKGQRPKSRSDRTARINNEVDKRFEKSAGEIIPSRWNDREGRWEYLIDGKWTLVPVHESLRKEA